MSSSASRSRSPAVVNWRRWAVVMIVAVVASFFGGGIAFAQGAAAAKAASPVAGESALPGIVTLAIVIALFVVPLLVGSRLSKSLRMPDHGWKFAVALGTLAAAGVIVYGAFFWGGEFGDGFKFGPDLSGGSTLIFELDKSAVDIDDMSAVEVDRLIERTIAALGNRVDPSGTKEVTIRKYGVGQIEIIIPKVSAQELAFIERQIYSAGILEFRITASPVFSDHRPIIEMAEKLPPGENVVRRGGNKVAQWMLYDTEKFGMTDEEVSFLVKRQVGQLSQALVLMNDGQDVTGDFLNQVGSGFDQTGQPNVRFAFDGRGSYLFGRLTGRHVPNPSGQKYHLGIVLDNKLLSAPSINEKITGSGEISGGMTQAEVDFVVNILEAGSLPAQLSEEPISRENISPTLGAETVEKGGKAILYSLGAVMVFILVYYRFAGFVACFALASNLLLILGLMVLFSAAFTLPGLAGLVLTIGMSVDANVLIFERIREERARGAALRMAIRNGFGRATQTIIDANVTTLITAIVIYKIAPDNVKGFGVTLIIGIVMSMYAAIFLSRIVFDVAERTRRIKELGMAQVIGKTTIDFIGRRGLAAVLSLLLIGVGLVAVFGRGGDLLNIDFTGGSSVMMVLKDDQKMSYGEVKSVLDGRPDLAEKNLSLVEVGKTNTQYTISSVEQDVKKVQEILQQAFGNRLKTHNVRATDVSPLSKRTGAIDSPGEGSIELVNFQEDAEEAVADDPPADDSEATDKATDEAAEETTEENTEETTEEPVEEEAFTASSDPFEGGTSARLDFSDGDTSDKVGIGYDAVGQLVQDALDATGHSGAAMAVSNPNYQLGSARRFAKWDVRLALPEDQARDVLAQLESATNSEPVFPLANKIGGRVAGDMKTKAIAAIVISLLGIVAYIWFRFQGVMYGLAAVVALVHDVLIALGMIALSGYLVSSIPALATGLMIEKFQIGLSTVAAFLTIIGYSLNDTIVVFDRIREVKGKSPKMTRDTINTSINQTLSRTLLTSLTTLLTVVLLYWLGGDGIHGFAFALVIGVVVGTYSSIFIASPALLWMSQRAEAAVANPGARAA